MSNKRSRSMMKLKPIRRRYRKIGRNENCPCGRKKWVEIPVRTKYFTGAGKQIPIIDERQVPVKYKHCCGNIDNQRKAMVVRRYISDKIHEVLSCKKISKLHALVNFFKKKS